MPVNLSEWIHFGSFCGTALPEYLIKEGIE